jgi:hypothetical protein
MPAAFDHVLLTRFSAVLLPDAPPPDPEWLWYRLQFFYDVTWPSVRSQTTRDFGWLVLFDDRCDDDFRANVEELADGTFTPLWSHEPFVRSSFAAPVAELLGASSAGHLVTTRIDSDDAMAVDFMAAVQARFDGQDRLFVNFTRGVQLDRSGGVYLSDTSSSPFLSFVERRRADRLPETVYVAKHARARAHAPVLEVRAPVMWAQVVHDSNVSNIVNGTRTDPAVVADRFRTTLPSGPELSRAGLRASRVAQARRLGRLWAERPGELTKFVGARGTRLRGTHVRKQVSGPTVEERLRGARRRATRRAWRVKNAVNGARRSEPQVVHGTAEAVLSRNRVVVLAEYAKGSELRSDAVAAASAWAGAGWGVVVVAARDAWVRRVKAPADLPEGVVVLARANVGYDFGSWRDALSTLDGLAALDLVVLTNDSLLGPFGGLEDLTARIAASTADVWAATASEAKGTHLQSYLVAFRDGVLERPGLHDFFAGVRALDSKDDVIVNYELGLTRAITAEGLQTQVEWPNAALGLPPAANPSAWGAAALIEQGLPFVKRSLRDVPTLRAQWEAAVTAAARLHGVDVG